MHAGEGSEIPNRSLLIVDDDRPFRARLARAMEKRGFEVLTAGSIDEGVEIIRKTPPAYAVLDLRIGFDSGLDIVTVLRKERPNSRIVILTGYGNIATAVAAVKVGAVDYLAKPADADAVEAAAVGKGFHAPSPTRKSNVCRSCSLGTHTSRLRAV